MGNIFTLPPETLILLELLRKFNVITELMIKEDGDDSECTGYYLDTRWPGGSFSRGWNTKEELHDNLFKIISKYLSEYYTLKVQAWEDSKNG